MKIIPRHYQQKGIDLTRKAYADGFRKILFWLATGGGKSIIFLMLIDSMLKKKMKIVFLVKRKQLIFQARDHFKKIGANYSIMMANEKGYNESCPVQICSIDTIRNREIEFLKSFDVVIIDEAHDTTSETYREILNELDIPLVIGLTATPFPVGNKVHDYFETVVKPIEVHELRDMGFLVPTSLYCPSEISMEGVKVSAGEYNQKQLADKMSQLEIVGDTVEIYKKYGHNLPAICFCVNREHSMRVAQEFSLNGIPAIHCDESTPQKQRDLAISSLKTGKIKVLCNVNIFSTGVDIPEAEVGIMARPTMSECLYIQQVGRLLRPYRKCGRCKSGYDNSPECPVCGHNEPEYIKTRAIILDQGNNTSRFGDPYDERFAVLKAEDKKKKEEVVKKLTKTCSSCFMIYDAKLQACPGCGSSGSKERFHKTKNGELVPYDEFAEISNSYNTLKTHQRLTGKKENWIFFKLYDKHGQKIMKYEKEFNIPKWLPSVIKKNKEKQLTGNIYT